MSLKARIDGIDGLRALAFLMVYIYHVWEFGGSPALRVGRVVIADAINRFPAGVDLFMVLSGFCLFWPVCRSGKWSVKQYAIRCVRRIVPPYYASIVYVTLLPVARVILFRSLGRAANWQPIPSSWQYVTHLTFTHTLFPATWAGIQGSYWTLALEAQFYVAFPICVAMYRRVGIWVTAMMSAISVVYRVLVCAAWPHAQWPVDFLLSITFLGRWMEFAAGMCAADFVANRRELDSRAGWALLLFSLALYCGASVRPIAAFKPFPARDLLLSLCFGLCLVCVCHSRSPFRKVFESKTLVFLGGISYSLYLLHQNTAYYMGQLLQKLLHLSGMRTFAVLLVAGLPAIIAMSYAFFRWFERPFMSGRDFTAPAAVVEHAAP
jgi:peptidoglycan/LPS O-acetylase OafA/YrhL